MTTSLRQPVLPDLRGRVTGSPGNYLTRRRHVDLVRLAGYLCR